MLHMSAQGEDAPAASPGADAPADEADAAADERAKPPRRQRVPAATQAQAQQQEEHSSGDEDEEAAQGEVVVNCTMWRRSEPAKLTHGWCCAEERRRSHGQAGSRAVQAAEDADAEAARAAERYARLRYASTRSNARNVADASAV